MSCNLTDKVKTLENLIRLSVICLREAARARTLFHAPASLVTWSVRAIQIKRGALERRRSSDDWERVCVSAADQSEGRLSQTLRSFRSAPRLLQTVTMDDFFLFSKTDNLQ